MSVSNDQVVRATAVITVRKYEPAAYDEPGEGPALVRSCGAPRGRAARGRWVTSRRGSPQLFDRPLPA
jgi:hypothetical protein